MHLAPSRTSSTPDRASHSHACADHAAGSGDRVDEIIAWLGDAKDTACWVAIDDLDLLKMNSKLKPCYFVRTDDAVGFGRDEADEAHAGPC